jgi:hypothetical protein
VTYSSTVIDPRTGTVIRTFHGGKPEYGVRRATKVYANSRLSEWSRSMRGPPPSRGVVTALAGNPSQWR